MVFHYDHIYNPFGSNIIQNGSQFFTSQSKFYWSPACASYLVGSKERDLFLIRYITSSMSSTVKKIELVKDVLAVRIQAFIKNLLQKPLIII